MIKCYGCSYRFSLLFILFFLVMQLSVKSQIIKENYTVNGVNFSMVRVEGGTFMMGATAEQGDDVDSDEIPHQVTLSPYMIGETEVTLALWKEVMGNNPTWSQIYTQPVRFVSWDDCQVFIGKLNILTGKSFRLPTEAEWEYAARGGSKSKGFKYSGSNDLDKVAWYQENSGLKIHPVATKLPNELGLYDMSGNVREWCLDWYEDYNVSNVIDPAGPSSGTLRVFRGGAYQLNNWYCRVPNRNGYKPHEKYEFIGFRLACTSINDSISNDLNMNNPGDDKIIVDEAKLNFERGEEFYKEGNYTEAMKWFLKSAEQGNADSQKKLGLMYANGYGVLQDPVMAEMWFLKSVEGGDADKQYSLGLIYENGYYGITRNYSEAVKWYRKSAEQGNADSQNNLGMMYANGKGITRNPKEAVRWFRISAEQGDAYGQYNLGLAYQKGFGVKMNLSEAKKWYKLAASQGDIDSQKRLRELNEQ